MRAQTAQPRGDRIDIVDKQRKVTSLGVPGRRRPDPASDQMQLLAIPEAEPSSRKIEGGTRQLGQPEHVSKEAHAGIDIAYLQSDMVELPDFQFAVVAQDAIP
jgi:hypothetical protein